MIIRQSKAWLKNDVVPFFKMCFYNTVCKFYIELLGTHDKRKMKYRISLCLIFKNEAPFLKEWLDYHLAIGIDHFYLYNNNSDDNYMVIVKPYVDKGIVTLIEWPEPNSQFKCYKHCYDTYREESNWISFLDADEFICPKIKSDVNDWIKDFDKYPGIVIQWLMFGTSGVLKHNYSQNVIEQYYCCWDNFYPRGKCIINTRFKIANENTWYMHHHTYLHYHILGIPITLPCVNQFGKICTVSFNWGGGSHPRERSTIQINHYFMKAWDIFDKKRNKTDVLFKVNPKLDYSKFGQKEEACVSRDYIIGRFFIKMKLYQGIIN